ARKAAALKAAAKMFDDLRDIAEDVTPDMLIDHIMSATGYSDMLEEEGDEGVPRFENINELKSNILAYTERMADIGDEPTLAGFLEEASLYTDADKTDEGMSAVNMMTIHGAKGLEFPVVFIIGAEENIFPSQRSKADPTQLEEERRLAYVAITRAKKLLYITHAQHRLLMGMTQYNQRSRFVREIDPDLIDEQPHHTEFTPAHTMRRPLERTSIPSRGALSAPPPITDFEPGCRVVHPKLGAGTVLSCKPMGGDSMVEIAFDTIGTKKVMAKFAKMRKE
ncbi:MAG: ATP-binding domain-containing protein, partial [Oscillospiraceae bacterium]|nr:ATP-binding domain-containing protein [Oscillospiraceae bacterium]